MRPALAAFGVLSAAIVAALLYFSFPDKVYVFDGVMFTFVIERNVLDLGSTLWNKRHLLFIPAMLWLRDLTVAWGRPVDGYALVQKVNAAAGVLGLGVFFLLVRDMTRRASLAAAAAAFLGVSYAYWSRATEGQVYMLMTLGALAVLRLACRLLERPSLAAAAAMAAAWAVATLLHAANGFLLPVAAAALLLAAPRERRPAFMSTLLVALAAVVGCYAAAFDLRGPDSLLSFAMSATEFGADAGGGKDSFWRECLARLTGLPLSLAGSPRRLFHALLAGGSEPWPVVAGAALALAAAAGARAAWPALDATQRRAVGLLAAGGLVFVVVDAYWLGGSFFWAVPAAAFVGSAAVFVGALGPGRRAAVTAAAAILAAGAWNFKAGILPQSRIENNAGYARAVFVRDHTVSTSWVVTSGLGFANSKVYLTKFSLRNNSALEYYLREAPKPQALDKFAGLLRGLARHGLPVYALSDLVEDGPAARMLKRFWGVELAEIRACFGPGRLVPTASFDPALRLYLFVPDGEKAALVAGLAFNALDSGTGPAADEALAVLRALASEMTPAERAQTRALLASTRYGAALVLAGIWPHLSAERRPLAQQYAMRFMSAPTPLASARLAQIAAWLR